MCTDTLKQKASRWCGCLWRRCFSFSIYFSCRQSSCQQLQLRGAGFWEDTEWNTYSLAKQGRAGNKNHSAVWNCSVFEEGRGIIYHIMKRHNEKDDKGIVMLNRGKLSCCRVFFLWYAKYPLQGGKWNFTALALKTSCDKLCPRMNVAHIGSGNSTHFSNLYYHSMAKEICSKTWSYFQNSMRCLNRAIKL